MKILIAANSDVGLYKFRKELLETLLLEHQVYISLPNGGFIPSMIEMGCIFECCEFERHGVNPIEELKLTLYYRKLIKKIKPDIVFTYTIKPNVYCGMACSSMGVPYVVNITGLGTALESGGLIQKIIVKLYTKGLRNAKKVFFQNTDNQNFMLTHQIVNGPYDLLPGSGVNLTQYRILEYPNLKTINFIFVARIMREKGIDQYLDAAEYIKKKYPKTRFHICGFCEDAYDEKLKELHSRGIILYHGLVKNMVEIQKISCCTIHPSYYPEGISNVLLESCACGRPIITTNRPGCGEVVEDGVNGFVVKEKDSQDLINKIEIFLSMTWEARKAMGIAGRKKVEKDYNREIVINKYLDEIFELRNHNGL